MVSVETERLLLRPWRADDLEPYAEFFADAEMARYVGGLSDRRKSWARLAATIGHWTLQGYGYWAVDEKATGEFVGCVGLWQSAGWPELELGYWLVRAMQGRGYATEAARRARDYAFAVVDADTLVSYIHPDNGPSKRVAERLDGTFEGIIDLLDLGAHCIYRYDKPPSA